MLVKRTAACIVGPIPIYLQQCPFPSNSTRKLKSSPFQHILAYPGYAPGTITVNVSWMERGFNAGQTRSSIYPSIFNRFPVIQPVSSKVRHFSTFFARFGLPWVRPWDNRSKCYMDRKRIQCWSNAWHSYGLNQFIINWITDFLDSRKYRVKVKGGSVAYWQSVGLVYHRYAVRFPARSLPCKNLEQVSHTQLQCSLIYYIRLHAACLGQLSHPSFRGR